MSRKFEIELHELEKLIIGAWQLGNEGAMHYHDTLRFGYGLNDGSVTGIDFMSSCDNGECSEDNPNRELVSKRYKLKEDK